MFSVDVPEGTAGKKVQYFDAGVVDECFQRKIIFIFSSGSLKFPVHVEIMINFWLF